MDTLSRLTTLVSGPLCVLQERGGHVVDVLRAHPWTCLGAATGAVLLWSYVRTPCNLPPGPWGYPLIGAPSCFTLELPARMLAWRKQYGDVISYYNHGHLYVILNSESCIREAFITQADHFSHMNVYQFNKVGIDDEIFAAPFGDSWKADKRFALSSLKNSGFGTAKSEVQVHKLLTDTIADIQNAGGAPVDIFWNLRLISAGAMSRIVLGGSGSLEDPDTLELLRLTDEWYATFNEAYVATSPFVPSIFIPQSIVSFFAAKTFANFKKVHRELMAFISKKVQTTSSHTPGGSTECVIDSYLRERGGTSEAIDTFVKTIVIFFPDALDTACIITSWCLLYVTHHPQAQQRLYQELQGLQSTFSTNQLPTFTDRLQMPYTQAVMAETLRLTHITPLSTLRVLKANMKVNGYTLPKGTNVSANYYAIHFDPEIFPEPFKFNPSRFIDADGKFKSTLAERLVAFSIGPRRCVGESYVRVFMFLVLTRLIQRFELRFDPAAPTPKLEPDDDFFFPKPQPFKVCFRSRKMVALAAPITSQ